MKVRIRFSKDGDLYRELDEGRNYYVTEAEEIVSNLRERLKVQKRTGLLKPFELLVDGDPLIYTDVQFDTIKTLEQQLIDTMKNYEGWDEELRQKYINVLKEVTAEEKRLFLNKEFKAFAVRFDQTLGGAEAQPFKLVLDIEHLKRLFDNVYAHITTGFYSEMETIVNSINTSFQTIVDLVYQEQLNVDKMEDQHKEEDNKAAFLEVRTITWLSNEENFNRFAQYIAANYQSVRKDRIASLYVKYPIYQEIEQQLFHHFANKKDFSEAYKVHQNMIKKFYFKFDEILFQGFVLKTDEMIESLVIRPAVNDIEQEILQALKPIQKEMGDVNGVSTEK